MPKKYDESIISAIQTLYFDLGLDYKQIAKFLSLSKSGVYGYTVIMDKGFTSRTQYLNELAKEKGYNDHSRRFRSKKKNSGEAGPIRPQNTASEEVSTLNKIANEQGFSTSAEMMTGGLEDFLKQEDAMNLSEFPKEYIKEMLSKVLNEYFAGTNQTKTEFARTIAISPNTLSNYLTGRRYPNKPSVRGRLIEALGLSYESFYEFLKGGFDEWNSKQKEE